jgi:hypothetical protein
MAYVGDGLKFVCFSLWYLYYRPVDSHHQHRPTADASHLIPVPPGFPGKPLQIFVSETLLKVTEINMIPFYLLLLFIKYRQLQHIWVVSLPDVFQHLQCHFQEYL